MCDVKLPVGQSITSPSYSFQRCVCFPSTLEISIASSSRRSTPPVLPTAQLPPKRDRYGAHVPASASQLAQRDGYMRYCSRVL
ncbi:hypothetical protein HBI06_162350 [Parastagonospora nodorum]|nr:hypothetical protein HBI06_162350 [Parastagonospora nodorum]